jgi:uncharacterized membrane protein
MLKKLSNINLWTFIVLSAAILLVVIDWDDAPRVVTALGRLHPVLMHLPIALVILLLPLVLLEQRTKQGAALRELNAVLLQWTAFLASCTALAGALLSMGSEYDQELLTQHTWWSLGLTISLLLLVFLRSQFDLRPIIWNLILVLQIAALMIGSHQGGSLTHGKDFLSFTVKEKDNPLPFIAEDSIAIWTGGIQPILNTKCISCHNPNKKKGGLDLSQYATLKTGGKSGSAINSDNPLTSELIKRIELELEDEKHMPPSGKPQLTNEELLILHAWVSRGASATIKFGSLKRDDSLLQTVSQLASSGTDSKTEKKYDFKAASNTTIEQLNNPFRSILPLAANSPALSVRFFLKENFTLSLLQECAPLSDQIVELNLTGMPCGDEIFDLIKEYDHLEKLYLNNTSVTGKSLSKLLANKHLELVSLTGTQVSKSSLLELKGSSIKKVFLWNSNVSATDISFLQQQLPSVTFELGYVPDKSELLKLTPPRPINTDRTIIAAQERIELRHPLPGAAIRYTLDGSRPDSINGILYTKPIVPGPITRIISIAFNDGWLNSEPSDFTYFQKGLKIDSVRLIHLPNERYRKSDKRLLLDLKKGFPEILNMNWLGYREETFKAGFYSNEAPLISTVVVSAADNTGAYVFPPARIIIKGGSSPNALSTIGSIEPPMPTGYRSNAVIPYQVPVRKGNYAYIEIEAVNLPSLPSWHGGKGQKAWVFVDEVFFY